MGLDIVDFGMPFVVDFEIEDFGTEDFDVEDLAFVVDLDSDIVDLLVDLLEEQVQMDYYIQ